MQSSKDETILSTEKRDRLLIIIKILISSFYLNVSVVWVIWQESDFHRPGRPTPTQRVAGGG